MRLAVVVAALSLGSTLSLADPAKPISDADRASYRALLKAGRTLQGKKQWADAMVKFEAAAKVVPDDPVALGELGWTAYLAKDLPRAEAATRKALAGQGTPSTRGAVLYNLALIREASQDRPAAIAAYRESLSVRPSGVVRAALAKLDPTAAAAFEPFHPAPLAGPFASIDAYCKSKGTQPPGDPDVQCACTAPAPIATHGPFAEAASVTYACIQPPPTASEPFGSNTYALAVRVPAGWFVTEVAHQEFNRRTNEALTFGAAAARTFGATPALTVAYTASGDVTAGEYSDTWKQAGTVILAAGKAPSATPPIVTTRNEVRESFVGDPRKVVVDVALSLEWTAAGLTLAGKTTGLDHGEATNLVGTHALVFP